MPLRSTPPERVDDEVTDDVIQLALKRFTTGIAVEPLPEPAPVTSRRRRLWQLPHQAHCPLVGLATARDLVARLVRKELGHAAPADAYEQHLALVQACRQRSPLAEALQRELDRRHAGTVRRYARIEDAAALLQTFEADLQAGDAGAALWATLTHPHADALQDRVCRRMHLHQHAAAADASAERRWLLQLQAECAAQHRKLAQSRADADALRRANAERASADERTIAALRLQLIARDAAVAALQSELDELRRAMPDLPQRQALLRRVDDLLARNRALARRVDKPAGRSALPAASGGSEPPRANLAGEARAPTSNADAAAPAVPPASAPTAPMLQTVRTVLCVGGRTRAVSQYRELVERRGARFLHHDGGVEDGAHALHSGLDAADVVFCQAGCVSHNAYAVVKVHCRRAGKQCVYLERPSVARFAQGLQELLPC